ncbi:dicarboxylate/amino acid:cation symporter [Psychrosphaera haliotis]|uniref:dicarboxylate/amino acid:cation symporter n=1 Tax=Psychrosphaera haliotis TaxID=555083 RepID=UPI0031DB4512
MLARFFSLTLSKQIFFAFVASIAFGLLFENAALAIKPIGTAYINAIKMVVIPLLFFSIVSSIFNFSDPTKLKRLGLKTLGVFLATAFIASLIGLTIGSMIDWSAGINLVPTETKEKVIPSIAEVLTGFIPSNIIDSMANGKVIPVVVFSVLLGLAVLKTGKEANPFKQFIVSGNQVMASLMKMILAVTPIGVFAIMAATVSQFGLDTLLPLGQFILAVYVGCLIHMAVTYSSLVAAFGKMNPVTFYKHIFEAQVTAYSTCSSYATLPVTTKVISENLKVEKGYASFVANIGSSANMDGCGGIYPAIAAIFIAHIYGISLDYTDYAMISFTAVISSIGSAGVPGAALVMLTVTLNAVGLPLEGIAFVAAIDRIIDMMRTATNITGDAVTALVVGQSEGLVSQSNVEAEMNEDVSGLFAAEQHKVS